MKSRTIVLLLGIYAVITTFGLSYYFVRDFAKQMASTQYADASHFKTSLTQGSEDGDGDGDGDVQHSPTFPIKKHIVTYGDPRTATTLLFNMVSTSYFLYSLKYNPEQASLIHLKYWKKKNATGSTTFLKRADEPYVIKTHRNTNGFLADNTLLFTAAMNRKEADEAMLRLTSDGHSVAFIQDMESLKESGVPGLVEKYVHGFGLSSKDKDNMVEYFSFWEILRQCCGKQVIAL